MIARAGKWLIRATLLLLVLCILVAAAIAFILNTESGTRWVIERANAAMTGELTVERFEGTLWRGLRIDMLGYADADQTLVARQVDFDLNWPSILAGRVALETLHARSVHRTSLLPPPPEPQPLELAMPPLPLAITVREASINELLLVSNGERRSITGIVVRNLRISGSKFQIATGTASSDPINVSLADFSIVLAGPVATAGNISWRTSDGLWSGRGAVAGNLAELQVQQDILGSYPAAVVGRLWILNRVDPEFDVVINWDLWNISERELRDGEVHLRGISSQFDVSYDTTVADSGKLYQLNGDASGNTDELSKLEARIVGDLGELELSGRLTWLPEFSAAAAVVATNINPALIRSELTGRLEATADLSVDADGALTVSGLSVAGQLNGAPVRARGDVFVASEELQCTRCVFNVGENRLEIEGRNVGDKLSLTASLNAPSLKELWPGLAGAAVGEAAIGGTVDAPRGSGNVVLTGLAYNKTQYGGLQLSWRGNLAGGELNASWQFEDIAATGRADVQFVEEKVSGVIRSATISKETLGDWVLQKPFEFRASAEEVFLNSHEWNGKLGNVQIAQLSLVDDTFRTVATARNIPLQLGNQMLPQNYQLFGSASADIDLTREAGLWSGTANWIQADTKLRVLDESNEATDVIIPRAEANASLVKGRVDASANIEIDPGVSGSVTISLEQLSADALMTGNLKLQGEDWGWISAVVPQIDRFGGSISAAVAAQGPLNAPAFSGIAEWSNGSLVVPSSNVSYDEIGVVITGASDGDASIEGSARAGDGTLQLTGRLNNLMQATRSANFTIKGDNAELVNWPEYRVWGSPNISLSGTIDAWDVSGQLDVPQAKIALREVPVGAVTISPDVVVLGEEDNVVRKTRISGETRLVLGDRVQFEALGLDTRLVGNVLFKQVEGRPISAEGRLELIDGTYAAQGQKLKIRQGELTFTGPLDDPLVDVRAVRVIETLDGSVTAGIHLRGRAQDLTTTVYSEPTMDDADALSYLVIGRPLSQATDSDGGELSGAAIALGLRQATRITDQIGQTLGLDQLSLTGDGGETTTLVAGKQINSRLHARYAYGVFSRLGVLLLRYRMSRSLTLEAGAGENQSIDLLYSIEK